MSPVRHWCESDYYRASRAARKAWECSQPQLVLGLEQDDGGGSTPPWCPSSSCSSPPSPTADAAPSRIPPQGGEGGLDKPNQGGTP